jgi:hypothetical protein
MTDSTKTTEQSQSSTTAPWAPAQGLLTNLIGQYGAQSPGVTWDQSNALDVLKGSVSNIPNFGAEGSKAISNLFNTDNSGQVGMLNSAYDTLKTNLSPTASGAHLNPYETPGFGDALRTMIDDATNKTKGVYAGSGRDPSGAGSFAGSLSRGITSGVAPTIASQYNQNYTNMIGANRDLFSGAGSTASGINNLNQQELANGVMGMQGAAALPGLYAAPAMAQYGAANQAYAQPFQNLAQLLQPSVALAGLGSQSSGTGTSTQTSTPSLMQSLMDGTKLAGSWLSGAGSAATAAPAIMAMFSDERLKEDIAPVGKLNDGQNVYSYRYKGDPVPRIGLMAQEVAQTRPEAVARHPSGYLMVDYGKAVRGARVGHLAEAA